MPEGTACENLISQDFLLLETTQMVTSVISVPHRN